MENGYIPEVYEREITLEEFLEAAKKSLHNVVSYSIQYPEENFFQTGELQAVELSKEKMVLTINEIDIRAEIESIKEIMLDRTGIYTLTVIKESGNSLDVIFDFNSYE